MLRRMHSHIVAQALGAEKFLPGGTRLRGQSPRNGRMLGQLSLVTTLVLLLWVALPQKAAAPNALAVVNPASGRNQTTQSIQQDATAPLALSATVAEGETNQATADAAVNTEAPVSDQASAPVLSTQATETGEDAPNQPSVADLAAAIAATRARMDDTRPVTEHVSPSAPSEPRRTLAHLFRQPSVLDVLHTVGITEAPQPAAPQPTPDSGLLVRSIDQEQVRLLDLFGAVDKASTTPGELAAMAQEALAALEEAASAETSPAQPPAQESAPESAPPPPVEPAPDRTPGSVWASFTPPAPADADHLWLQSPFPDGYNQFYSPNYQFGSTANGRYRIHHGVDISNPAGTPILAPAEGEVVHAGPDNPTLLGPYNNFYGNAVVIRLNRRLPTPEGEKDVYVLYGHMSEVYVARGQQVTPGEPVGAVGMTGIAIGPHLHVEVRLGQNSYLHTVNPALWMQPVPGTGALAVRLLDAQGRTWPQSYLSLLRFDGDTVTWTRTIEIYPEAENVTWDPAWGENGAMNNLPPGAYYITGKINGEKVGQNLVITPGETTFVELRTQQ